MRDATKSAITPSSTHITWRTKYTHVEPYSASDCTDDAESTITRPMTSSTPVSTSSSQYVDGRSSGGTPPGSRTRWSRPGLRGRRPGRGRARSPVVRLAVLTRPMVAPSVDRAGDGQVVGVEDAD